VKKRKKKKAKPKPNSGPVPPKCSQEVADIIAALSDEELLDYGCPYPCGSGAKVEWLRERQRFANSDRLDDNAHMDAINWDPRDNPNMIERPCTGGQHPNPRQQITQLHLPE